MKIEIPKIKTKKIKEFFKKLPQVLAERAFLTFLFLFLIVLIIGGIVFYKYNVLAKKAEPQILEQPLQFQEKTYQSVLKIWQEKEKRFEAADFKEYLNPFRID